MSSTNTLGMTLEQRIVRLEDIEAIRTLTHGYHDGINEHDLERICAGFSEDAVVVLSSGVPIVGMAAVRAAYERATQKIKMVKQFISALTIEVSGKTAKASAWLDARYVDKGDPESYLVAGKLLYEYVKRDGRWYTSRYEVRLQFRAPISEGFAGERLIYK